MYDVSIYDFTDETEILHSQIINENTVEVHFERPTEEGFDVARCSLPTYEWIKREGFSDADIELFEKFLRSNAHLLYKYAENGGIKIAFPTDYLAQWEAFTVSKL